MVEVSIGSPTPSDSQSISRELAVQSMLEQLLGEVDAPPGSIELHGAQAATISGSAALVLDDDVVQVWRTWQVPGAGDVVLTYMKAHVPKDLTFDGSSGSIAGESECYTQPAGPLEQGATLCFSVLPDPGGGVDLRAEAQDIWRPNRSAAENVAPTVGGATIVRTVNQTGPVASPVPPETTLRVGAQPAQRIAALLNALPTYASGPPPASGGPPTSYAITFTNAGITQTFTTGDDFGLFAVEVTVDGVEQPMFEDASALVSYLTSLFNTP